MADRVPVSIVLKAMDKMSGPLRRMQGSLGRFSEAARNANRAFTASQRRGAETRAAYKKTGAAMQNVGKKMTLGVTLPVVGFGASIIRTASQFESSMNTVGALLNKTPKDMKPLRDMAKKLGATTQFSASQAADAMGDLARKGFSAAKISASIGPVMQLAAAGQLDLAEAAKIGASAMSAFRMKASDLPHINDVLAKAATSTSTSVRLVGESFKYVGPVAAAMGISMEEAAAATGLLANNSIHGEMAGAGLRAILAKLVNPAGEAKKALNALGIDRTKILDSKGNVKSLFAVIDQLKKRGAKVSDLSKVFGVEAMPHIAALMGEGAARFKDITNSLKNSTGEAARLAKANMEGSRGAMLEFTSAFEGLQIAIADSGFLAFFTKVTKRLTGFIQRLSETNPQFLKWGSILAGIAAFTGPFLAGLGFMVKGLGGLLPLLSAAKWAVFGLGKAFLLNPIGLVITALGLLAVGIYMVVKHWDKVKAWLAGFWVKVKAFTDTGVGKLLTALFPVIGVPILIAKHWDKIKIWAVNFWTGLKAFFGTWVGKVVGVIFPFIGIPMAIIRNWDTVRGWAKSFWGFLQPFFAAASTRLVEDLESFKSFPDKLIAWWQKIEAPIAAVWDGIGGIIKEGLDWMADAFMKVEQWIDSLVGKAARSGLNLLSSFLPDSVVEKFGSALSGIGVGEAANAPALGSARPLGPDRKLPDQSIERRSEAAVTVKFEGAPKGTRVEQTKNTGVDLGVSTGYAFGQL